MVLLHDQKNFDTDVFRDIVNELHPLLKFPAEKQKTKQKKTKNKKQKKKIDANKTLIH